MVLIDSHCHLFDMKNYLLPPDIFPVIVGYSHGSNKKAVESAKKGYPLALGIAPQTALKEDISKLDEWVEFIRNNKPNAIGEVGLDYKWAQTKADVEKQKTVFRRMVGLAKEMALPLVIHSRNNPLENEVPKNAINDIIDMVDGMQVLMHFYTGNEMQAAKIVSNGGYISAIHLRSKERRKVINTVPLDRLLIESDCPYVGRTPETVREAVAYIAEVKNLDVDTVAKATTQNAMRFFKFRV